MTGSSRLRCAIYTRKSSEEGLDQDFNSLDAQREACEAFITSQAGLGWKPTPVHYDDGGISGGTMERPALQRLLDDIRAGTVDVVVVYKIDRLTRSLMDFARMVDIFEERDVSFVSVTQAFNTTSSMGRLTLNVLLSFAQFEREVTAERIRDKIAASKKKGMWMGGSVPLGYRAENKKLVIDDAEAKTVRLLFNRYTELKSVTALSTEAASLGLMGKSRYRGDGTPDIARPLQRGALYHLLSNPIYIGKIRHKELVHDGNHNAIIDEDLFQRVQNLLAEQAPAKRQESNTTSPHLLTSILHDETGDRLTPTHANKKGKRYRYYVSSRLIRKGKQHCDGSGWRVPAEELDSLVEREMNQCLCNHAQLTDWTREFVAPQQLGELTRNADAEHAAWNNRTSEERRQIIRTVIHRIDLKPHTIRFEINRGSLSEWLLGEDRTNIASGTPAYAVVERPLCIRRRGVETRLVLSDGLEAARSTDPSLVNLIVRANCYLATLTDGSGKSLTQVAEHYQTDLSSVSRMLPLAFLSPKIVDAILTGSQPTELNSHRIGRISDLPNCWSEQAIVTGF